MAYRPPYQITRKMNHYISEIMKVVGQLEVIGNLDSLPELRKLNRISAIQSSLAIEGNTLTKGQISDIMNGNPVYGESMREIQEAKNAIEVYDQVLEINPYDVKDLLKYHKMMTKALIVDAGHFRKEQVGVYQGNKALHLAPPADRVPHLINQLFDYVNNDIEHFLIKSCVFHFEFELIHPFSDGNGRMGRLFQTCLMLHEEPIFAAIPVESIIKERQQDYYQALQNSQRSGESTTFIEFMLDVILEAIKRTYEKVREGYYLSSIQVKKMMNLMEDGIPYTTLELMDELKMKSRASFKKHYMDPAIKEGFVKMTIPEKPSSRNQRYIKK